MRGLGYGNSDDWAPFPNTYAQGHNSAEPEEQYTPAGLLHECNRLIAKANDAMAAKDVAGSKTYMRLMAGEIQHALGYHD